MTNKDKKFFIPVSGQWVEVSEEIYYEYYRPIWRTRSNAKYRNQCRCHKSDIWKCDGVCQGCEFYTAGNQISFDGTVDEEEGDDLMGDLADKVTAALAADSGSAVSSPKPVEKCPYAEPKKDIQYGAKGNNVRWVQWHLNKAAGEKLAVDGDFGKLTKAAVLRFQKNKKLAQDGIVGPKTRAALKKAVG